MNCGFIKVASATPHVSVADTEYNAARLIECMREAAEKKVKILVTPEMSLTGYTCGDLFLQDTLIRSAEEALGRVAEASVGLDMLVAVGLPLSIDGNLYNCAAVLYEGDILGVVPKCHIPNYAEYYEKRYFKSGQAIETMEISVAGYDTVFGSKILFRNETLGELCVAVEICEDLWVPNPPSISHALAGANVLLNLSASNETVTKDDYRRELVKGQSARLVCGYLYADAGNGESTQDAVYTGHDLICENGALLSECENANAMILSELDISKLQYERRKLGTFRGDDADYCTVYWESEWEETELTREISKTPFLPNDLEDRKRRFETIIGLQSLGLKKRIEHTKAKTLVVGLSGGLDSTLALIICARALDMLDRPRSDILAVTMPCFGTTEHTRTNAELLAEEIGANLKVVNITETVKSHFKDIGQDENCYDVVFENAQARERTQVLMDIANGCSGLAVGTGDLSELALGWATYNGDHMSMYGVNGGVPKTLVRHLVAYIAGTCESAELKKVLVSILETPVSPELLPAQDGEIAQKTEDLVGPYELHDFFLYYLIRWGFEPKKVFRLARYAFDGEYEDETILKWLSTFIRRFFNQQFKRSCLPDGPKVGTLTLSPRGDWRMPSDASAAIWLRQLEEM